MTCPHASDQITRKSGDVSTVCTLLWSQSGVRTRVSQRHVCTVCQSQWTNGKPPVILPPILKAIHPRPGLGDHLASLIRRLRLDRLAQRMGLYSPATCGCKARQAKANAYGRELRRYWLARFRSQV